VKAIKRKPVLIVVAIFLFSIQDVVASAARPRDLEVTIRVNEQGFFNNNGRLLGPQQPLTLPKGRRVKMTFLFDEALSSLAIGDTHQIAISAEDGWRIEGEPIRVFHQKTSVTFEVGANGRNTYRGYCILNCIGMNHLKNFTIKVV
jgi:hypothetical protein